MKLSSELPVQSEAKLFQIALQPVLWASAFGVLALAQRLFETAGFSWAWGIWLIQAALSLCFIWLLINMRSRWRCERRKPVAVLFREQRKDDRPLIWIASRDEAAAAFASEADVPFEPVIVRAWYAHLDKPNLRRMAKLLCVTVGTTVLFSILFTLTGWSPFLDDVFGNAVILSIPVAILGEELLSPRYFRVTPGQLEVLQFKLWGGRAVVETVPLRMAHVYLDFKNWVAVVVADGQVALDMSARFVWGRDRLLKGLLAGAVSSHATHPLPNEELLG